MSSSTPLFSLLDVAALDAPKDAEAKVIRPFQVDDKLIDLLRGEIARSYLSIYTFEDLYHTAGMDNVFDHLRTHSFPKKAKTLKGNFGEVLCQAYVKAATDFEIPYPKLRFRFSKEPSPHGEDVVAFLFQDDAPDVLLLIETKLRTGPLGGAISQAYKTACMSIKGQSECFLLNQVLAVLDERGDKDLSRRVNTMLTDYHGDEFSKVGGVFIVGQESQWQNTHFLDHIEENELKPLWCWAFVVEDLKDLIKRAH